MYEYKAKVINIIDGDTLDLEIDLGFYVSIKIRARLLEVNTPERGDSEFASAKALLATLIEKNKDLGGFINIKTQKTEKYGRWLVYIDNINNVLKERWPYV